MSTIAAILTGLIAILHLYILWFEMFHWTTRGPRVFDTMPRELFESTQVMAANQGLYNGFLAAGLLWSLFIQDPHWQKNVAICFLLFVLVAGLYGWRTVSKKILYVQVIPAVLALAAVMFG